MWLLNLFLYKEQTGLIDFPQQLGYFQILCLLKYSYLPRGGKSNGELKKDTIWCFCVSTLTNTCITTPLHTQTHTHTYPETRQAHRGTMSSTLCPFFFHQLSVSSLMNYSPQVEEVAHPNPTFSLILSLNIFYYWLNHKQSKMHSI